MNAPPRVRDYVALLTRTRDIEPGLASQIRRRVNAGVSDQQAAQFIGLLRLLPGKPEGSQ